MRNGEIMEASQGIDPAFDYNTGKVGIEVHASKVLGHSLQNINVELAAQIASADFVAQAAKTDPE
ncbi:MAG: hypothetical protein LBT47_11080 [Deltaproteobacteria bacterium]|jgi:hypothetical protein|nr:hypothetical protein [Deltaproteobacteria bacterium]